MDPPPLWTPSSKLNTNRGSGRTHREPRLWRLQPSAFSTNPRTMAQGADRVANADQREVPMHRAPMKMRIRLTQFVPGNKLCVR